MGFSSQRMRFSQLQSQAQSQSRPEPPASTQSLCQADVQCCVKGSTQHQPLSPAVDDRAERQSAGDNQGYPETHTVFEAPNPATSNKHDLTSSTFWSDSDSDDEVDTNGDQVHTKVGNMALGTKVRAEFDTGAGTGAKRPSYMKATGANRQILTSVGVSMFDSIESDSPEPECSKNPAYAHITRVPKGSKPSPSPVCNERYTHQLELTEEQNGQVSDSDVEGVMTSLDLNLEDSSHAQDNAHSHSPAEQAEEADYGKPHSRNPSLQNGRISKRKGPTSTELLDFSTSALDGGGCTGRGSDVEELPPRKKSRIKARTQTDKGRAYIQKKINGHLGTTAHMGKLQRKPEVVNKNQSVRSEAAVRAITHTRMPKHRGLNKGARKVYQSRLAFEPCAKSMNTSTPRYHGDTMCAEIGAISPISSEDDAKGHGSIYSVRSGVQQRHEPTRTRKVLSANIYVPDSAGVKNNACIVDVDAYAVDPAVNKFGDMSTLSTNTSGMGRVNGEAYLENGATIERGAVARRRGARREAEAFSDAGRNHKHTRQLRGSPASEIVVSASDSDLEQACSRRMSGGKRGRKPSSYCASETVVDVDANVDVDVSAEKTRQRKCARGPILASTDTQCAGIGGLARAENGRHDRGVGSHKDVGRHRDNGSESESTGTENDTPAQAVGRHRRVGRNKVIESESESIGAEHEYMSAGNPEVDGDSARDRGSESASSSRRGCRRLTRPLSFGHRLLRPHAGSPVCESDSGKSRSDGGASDDDRRSCRRLKTPASPVYRTHKHHAESRMRSRGSGNSSGDCGARGDHDRLHGNGTVERYALRHGKIAKKPWERGLDRKKNAAFDRLIKRTCDLSSLENSPLSGMDASADESSDGGDVFEKMHSPPRGYRTSKHIPRMPLSLLASMTDVEDSGIQRGFSENESDNASGSDGEALPHRMNPEIQKVLNGILNRSSTRNAHEAYMIFVEMLLNSCVENDFRSSLLKDPDDYYFPAWTQIRSMLSACCEIARPSKGWPANIQSWVDERPKVDSEKINGGRNQAKCQACGRSKHTASLMVQFSGGKYDPLTLQDIKTNANDTSTTKTCFSLGDASATENGVLRSINSTANGNVRVLRKFDCGPTCAKRLLAYHKLKHYPYTLLQRCRQKMNSIGNGPESVDKLFDDKMWINNQKREFQSSIEAAEALGLS